MNEPRINFNDTQSVSWSSIPTPVLGSAKGLPEFRGRNVNPFNQADWSECFDKWNALNWLERLIIQNLVQAMNSNGWEIRNEINLTLQLRDFFRVQRFDELLIRACYFAFVNGHCVLLWAFDDSLKPWERANYNAENYPFTFLFNPRIAGSGHFYPGVFDDSEQSQYLEEWSRLKFSGTTLRGSSGFNYNKSPLAQYFNAVDHGSENTYLAIPRSTQSLDDFVLIHPSRWVVMNTCQAGGLFSGNWIDSIRQPVNSFIEAQNAMVASLKGSSSVIYGVENLWEILQSNDVDRLKARLEAMKIAFDKYSIIPRDKEREVMEWASKPMDGMPSVADELRRNVTAASNMSDLMLWGIQGSGLASDSGQVMSWSNTVRGYQNLVLKPAIEYLLKINAYYLGISDFNNITIDFLPVDTETWGDRAGRVSTEDMISSGEAMSNQEATPEEEPLQA